jgi:hypothetical protein
MNAKIAAKSYLGFVSAGGQPALGSPWENLQDALDGVPERAWRIILWAIALSRTEDERSFIGTGPLEYLLVHSREYLDRALRLAERHPKFRDVLRSSDIRGGADDDVARLDAYFESVDEAAELPST